MVTRKTRLWMPSLVKRITSRLLAEVVDPVPYERHRLWAIYWPAGDPELGVRK